MTITNGFSRCLEHILTVMLVIFTAATAAADSAGPYRSSSLLAVEAIGTGREDPKYPPAATAAATSNALDLALDEAINRLVPTDILSANFDIIDALFYGTREKYVLNYTVLAVSRRNDYCRSLVRATFADDAMKNRITSAGILLDREITPRLLMLISEQQPDRPPLFWWRLGSGQEALKAVSAAEKAMAAIFNNRGLSPLSPDEVLKAVLDFRPGADIGRDEAIYLAERAGADFVIIGQVETGRSDQKTAGGRGEWLARTAVRAFDVKADRLLDDISVKGVSDMSPGAGVEEALTRAGEAAAVKLAPALVTAFQERLNQTRSIDIIVRGKNYLAGLNAFQERLGSIEAVTSFQLSEMKSYQTVFKVTYAGSADRLAAALSAGTDKARITIQDVSADQIVIQMD